MMAWTPVARTRRQKSQFGRSKSSKLLSQWQRAPPQAGPQVQRHTGADYEAGRSPSAQRGAAFTRPYWSSPAAPRSRLGSWQGHHRGHPRMGRAGSKIMEDHPKQFPWLGKETIRRPCLLLFCVFLYLSKLNRNRPRSHTPRRCGLTLTLYTQHRDPQSNKVYNKLQLCRLSRPEARNRGKLGTAGREQLSAPTVTPAEQ